MFHHQMKHLEVRQKYSATRRIFNSLLGVSSGDETLRLMFDILLIKLYTMLSTLGSTFWEVYVQPVIRNIKSKELHKLLRAPKRSRSSLLFLYFFRNRGRKN